MLVEHTLFGVRDKVETAIERLKTFEPAEGYYVAFSGGKDSCVILDLVRRSGCKYDAHYNLTTVDQPELVYFIKTFKDVRIEKSDKTMWDLIVEKNMPPTRLIRFCCERLKERGGTGRHVVTGVRWSESTRRSKRRMAEVCKTDKTKRFLHVIIDWTDEDVWEYIHENDLKYCKLYDEGYKRLGCIMCPMKGQVGMKEDAERYPKYYQAYIRALQRVVEKQREGEGTEKRESGQAYMDWWINNTSKQDAFKDELGLYC